MAEKSKKLTTNQSQKSVLTILRSALQRKFNWETKDDFLDSVYWIRQLLSGFLGLVWGLIQLSGALALLAYAVVNSAMVYGYSLVWQSVDDEEYGGLWELIKEGFITSLATFLVVWIITYSASIS